MGRAWAASGGPGWDLEHSEDIHIEERRSRLELVLDLPSRLVDPSPPPALKRA